MRQSNGQIDRLVFDGEELADLSAPLELGWKARGKSKQAFMDDDLTPFLKNQTQGLGNSRLAAYE